MASEIARLVAGSTAFNTINLPTVEILFQRSPGHGRSRGIEGLQFNVVRDGRVIQNGVTGADGKILALLPGGSAQLQLLAAGAVVARYDLVVQTTGIEPVEKKAGQQQRLRILGYQVGHAGPLRDGIVNDDVPIGKITDRNEGETFERSLLDFQADIGSLPGNSTIVGPLVKASGV